MKRAVGPEEAVVEDGVGEAFLESELRKGAEER